jgi:hypothetical protein
MSPPALVTADLIPAGGPARAGADPTSARFVMRATGSVSQIQSPTSSAQAASKEKIDG